MKYEETELIKQSAKSTVHLVREKDSGQIFIRKVLKGQHPVYTILQEHSHPFLPVVHEVIVTDDATTVVEEYIEGEPSGNGELSQAQFLSLVGELCSVLEFLHGQGIIHRDIKPSNIIMAKDGHIRLIDFDAARQPKDDLEQDTVLLGTRGFAPPEQYGFSQTDERADIYSLGVTLAKLGGKTAEKAHYKRVIRKCTDMDPAKRYQSVRQVRRAFFRTAISFHGKILPYGKSVLCAAAAFCIILLVWSQASYLYGQHGEEPPVDAEGTLEALPAPANPHWDGDTGTALWGIVPESGLGSDQKYYRKLYRKATDTTSGTDEDILVYEGYMAGDASGEYFPNPMIFYFEENGFYYFTVCAVGDGIHYADSPYVTSDLFEYTGESAPMLPQPNGLTWGMLYNDESRRFFAIIGNLDEYEDEDWFDVKVYDKDDNFVMNTMATKADIISRGWPGVRIRSEFLADVNNSYHFVVCVYSSRPNEYRSTTIPEPIPEEYFSTWCTY